ncbi:ribose-phosphate pyrophosphokinase [Sphingomonas aracearum]|uniref:Ribose-phosphate pyrophosphokinase n=1 Tax=Sphingomonas aracearum TaxID=2283317 RepID=A0A369VZM7_9SPHN|nr:ribose-phosphate pyrophosphokinase [Sphingomonas aracearum]RDE06522.1 ribose-phosphate pyrophosphokinase [Sphingomonas aracearum]
MTRASGHGDTLSRWLEAEGIVPVEGPGAIADVARIRALLIEAAGEGRALSYSELLGQLGHRFTRPKMRALCRTLDAIDRDGSARGEPELAVLVVRETDRLPGAGWWSGRADAPAWNGPEARAYVERLQRACFDWRWRG